jgi:2-octaprenyl-6-methoxyphenol hydroxylase
MLKLLTQSCVKTNFKSPPLSRISRIISRNFQTDRRDFDIVIVGGGIIGRTLASCLVSSKFTDQLKIALIDNAYKPNSKVEREQIFDLRTVAISPTTKEVFNRIGVWDRISPFANMYDEMIVWDSKGNASMNFKEKEGLGYIISNTLLSVSSFPFLNNEILECIN